MSTFENNSIFLKVSLFVDARAANEDPVIPEDEIWEEEIVDLPPQKYGKGIFIMCYSSKPLRNV